MNQQIFNEIQALKRQILPENSKLILFGSQARGNAKLDSDWDLMVLLDKKGKITYEEDAMYGYPFDTIGWKYGTAVNTLLYSTEDWENRKITPFYKNIAKEGIEII
jgi:predicted nucleotidyltransferase